MEPEKKIFRAEVSTIYLPTIQISLISGFALCVAILFKEDLRFHIKTIEAILFFEAVLIPFLLLIFLIFIFFNRIKVNESGISTISPYSSIPKREFISWVTINQVLHKNVMGYEYYLLCSNEAEITVWLPKRIKDQTMFYYAVRSFAGNSNLFTLELMKSET